MLSVWELAFEGQQSHRFGWAKLQIQGWEEKVHTEPDVGTKYHLSVRAVPVLLVPVINNALIFFYV